MASVCCEGWGPLVPIDPPFFATLCVVIIGLYTTFCVVSRGFMNLFSERLKEIRSHRNITQKTLSEYLEVSLRHIQRYESGQYQPSIEGLIALADYFNVSLDYLVGRDDIPNRKEQPHE